MYCFSYTLLRDYRGTYQLFGVNIVVGIKYGCKKPNYVIKRKTTENPREVIFYNQNTRIIGLQLRILITLFLLIYHNTSAITETNVFYIIYE